MKIKNTFQFNIFFLEIVHNLIFYTTNRFLTLKVQASGYDCNDNIRDIFLRNL